jgi:hypothetical protein
MDRFPQGPSRGLFSFFSWASALWISALEIEYTCTFSSDKSIVSTRLVSLFLIDNCWLSFHIFSTLFLSLSIISFPKRERERLNFKLEREIDRGMACLACLPNRIVRLGFHQRDLQLDEESIVVSNLLLLLLMLSLARNVMLLVGEKVLGMMIVVVVENDGFGDTFGVGD